MSKAVQIHLSQPCHENWHNMTPNEQGRYCGSCQKTLVDFSAMSDKELLEYIANVSGYTACGRFSNDQLDRTITTTENKRRFSWAYVWNILLATFMITEADAQVCPPRRKGLVPSVIKMPDTLNPAISTVGYKAETFNKDNSQLLNTVPAVPLTALEGRVGGYSVGIKIPIKERVTRVVNSCIPVSLKKDIVVYPNPIERGDFAQLKLALPKGNYKLEVVSTSGQIMWGTSMNIQTKELQYKFPTRENWSAGTYWVRISSNTTTKVFQSKLLLQ